jgi:hypothetical protein
MQSCIRAFLCAVAEHFSGWSLLLHGHAGKATFCGRLETP